MAFETNVLGNLLVRYDHGPDRLLAETQGIDTRTWLTDALRTPVKRLTEAGSTYSVTRYDEYGQVEEETSPDTPRFGFTGHQRGPDGAPDLYYAQQRWYNSATGRFISEDPLWGEPKMPMSRHRYLYAYANPGVYVDPDGRVGIFNDGTDQDAFYPLTINDRAITNVGKLRKLYQGVALYRSGIGTEDGEWLCRMTGCGLEERVDWAYQRIVEIYNDPDSTEEDRRIDIFGFSRGAAVSMALVQKLSLEGIPVTRRQQIYTDRHRWETVEWTENVEANIRFVGLFDTVAARGLATTPDTLFDKLHIFLPNAPTDRLRVRWSQVGGQVRQAASAQEYRNTFDLISLRSCDGCPLPSNVQEEFFLGAHSNVGGGYGISDGGNPLATYSLSYMYREALALGVPLAQDPSVGDAIEGMHEKFFELIDAAHDSRFPVDRFLGRISRSIYFGGASGEPVEFTAFEMLQKAVESAERIDPLFIHEDEGAEP
ncbi:phospholipase effector Tle1 domain-containing protein [Wenzhouxiangella marina]|uniref:T6SS Phospholipase effector Tle1-like catalytic domain-containing protein n=1 Tax=Wenzhouxiangella marina TaxID=1579979 RepID=A0A0K0XZG7_9GAMM|nr:DUF2235 domain-containing protein [Wenzhouxiangella marina]AKS43016.1 hypothetical protein WM2015_2658 [Wenzhouxiangella marina]MBB6087301.1 RHS repeat-associated protein [Wenzhouxiangella marina]